MAKPGAQTSVERQAKAKRRRQVASLYLMGHSQWDIADRFQVNQSTISKDLSVIRRAWLMSAVQDFDKLKAKELAKLDQVEVEAWQAWLRSQQPAEIIELVNGKKKKYEKEVMKGQTGDARFLDVVNECIRRRSAILGIEAPKKKELSGPGGGPIQGQTKIDLFQRIAEYRSYLESFRNGSTLGNGTPVATLQNGTPVRNGILPETDEKNGHV